MKDHNAFRKPIGNTPKPVVPGLGKLLGNEELSKIKVDGIDLSTAALLDAQPAQTDHDKHLTVRRMQEELMCAVLAISETIATSDVHVVQLSHQPGEGDVVDAVVFKADPIDGKRKAYPNRFAALGHLNALIKCGRAIHVNLVKDHNKHQNHQHYLDQVRDLMKWSQWEKPDNEPVTKKITTPASGPSSN